MKEIRRLTQIVHRLSGKRGLKITENISVTENTSVALYKMIAIAHRGKINDDDEAAASIYKGSNAKDHRYVMLKSRVRARLLNQMIYAALNSEDTDPETECMACLTRAKMFLNEKEYVLAERQLIAATDIARKLEFTELYLVGLRMIRIVYYALNRPFRLKTFIPEIDVQQQKLIAEEEAAQIFYAHRHSLEKSVNSRGLTLPKTPEVLEQLHRLWLKSKSSDVFRKHFELSIAYYVYSHEYTPLLEYCQRTEAMLAGGEINIQKFGFGTLHRAVVLALLKVQSYQECLNYAGSCLKTSVIDDKEILDIHELRFISALRLKQWDVADDAYNRVRTKLESAGSSEEDLKWEILKGYLLLITDDDGGTASQEFKTLIDKSKVYATDSSLIVRLYILIIAALVKSDNIGELLKLHKEADKTLRGFRTPNAKEAYRLTTLTNFLRRLISLNFEPTAVKASTYRMLQSLKYEYDPYSPSEVIPFGEVIDFIISPFQKAQEELKFGKQ